MSSCSVWVKTEKAQTMSTVASGMGNVLSDCLIQVTSHGGLGTTTAIRWAARVRICWEMSVPM